MQRRWHELMDTTNLEDVAHEPFFQVVTHGGGVPQAKASSHTHTHTSKIIWNRNEGVQRQGSDKIPLATQPRLQAGCLKGVCVVLAPRRWGLAEPREHAAAIATE